MLQRIGRNGFLKFNYIHYRGFYGMTLPIHSPPLSQNKYDMYALLGFQSFYELKIDHLIDFICID